MKIHILSFIAITTFFIVSCGPEKNASPAPEKETSEFTTKVVVEKYTGEWCGDCPRAGAFFDKNKNSKNFIGIALHAGGLSDRYKDNLATKSMYNHTLETLREGEGGGVSFPMVMFNRGVGNNDKVINGFSSNEWQSRFDELAAKNATCGLSIASKISSTTLSVDVRYKLSKELEGEHAITVCIVENNLDGSKQNGGGPDYMQHHVLRELLTDKAGIPILNDTLKKAVKLTGLTTVDISKYDTDNLEVIAFIHKKGADFRSRGILNGQIVQAGKTQDFD